MSDKATIGTVDDVLRPLGFTRRKAVWNRRSKGVVEVVGLQLSKGGDTVTINAGVLDTEVHLMMWGNEAPSFVEDATCTVVARVGQLIDGQDLWWQLDDAHVGEKASRAVVEHVLPFVEHMRSRHNMVEWLVRTEVATKKYPPPIINLAILQVLLGALSNGCELLDGVRQAARGAWRTRAAEVAERLGCPR